MGHSGGQAARSLRRPFALAALLLSSWFASSAAQYIALNCGGLTSAKNVNLPSYYGSVSYGLGPDYQGNNSYTASDGTQYLADAYYQGTSNHVTDYYDVPIANTKDPKLYQTERYGLDLYYEFNLPNGAYTVEMHFAELLYQQRGQRQFYILVQGVQVEDRFDIIAQAGAWNTALVKQYSATVSNGLLEIYMNSQVYEAQVCAIKVFPASASRDGSNPGSLLYPPPSQMRIDSGSSADAYYQGGTAAASPVATTGTTLPSYFQTYRTGANVVYYLNLPNGDYTVEFSFVEPQYSSAGQRKMDVYMQTVPVFRGLDIFANAKGQNVALVVAAAAHVPNGLLRIQFVATQGTVVISGINVYPLTSSTNTQLAIDCGSPLDILAGTGVIYTADAYFSGGTALVTQPYQVFLPYLNLWDDFLYVSARTGASVYTIPVPNGYYVVEFRLAEIEDKKAGERVFSIAVQGQQVYSAVDIVGLTGGVITPIILTAPAIVTSGTVTIRFSDNAIINGLYIRPSLPTGPSLLQGPAAAPVLPFAPVPAPLARFPSPAPAPAPAPKLAPRPAPVPAPAPAPNSGVLLAIDVGEPDANYTSTSMGMNFAADVTPCLVGGQNGTGVVPVGSPFCWSNSGDIEGGLYRVPANAPIANTTDATLYQTARYGGVGFSVNLPNGFYNVTSYFAELDRTVVVGDRVFHIAYNGVVLAPNVDPLALGGGALYTAVAPVVKRVTVTEGVLRIQLLPTLPPSKRPPFLSALSIRAA